MDDLELFEAVSEHVSREDDVEPPEPDILTSVLPHGLLRVCVCVKG